MALVAACSCRRENRYAGSNPRFATTVGACRSLKLRWCTSITLEHLISHQICWRNVALNIIQLASLPLAERGRLMAPQATLSFDSHRMGRARELSFEARTGTLDLGELLGIVRTVVLYTCVKNTKIHGHKRCHGSCTSFHIAAPHAAKIDERPG